jgi:hypothetical protein
LPLADSPDKLIAKPKSTERQPWTVRAVQAHETVAINAAKAALNSVLFCVIGGGKSACLAAWLVSTASRHQRGMPARKPRSV